MRALARFANIGRMNDECRTFDFVDFLLCAVVCYFLCLYYGFFFFSLPILSCIDDTGVTGEFDLVCVNRNVP